MKAAVYRQYHKDPRQEVKIEDIDTPNPKSNEVVIKVEAAAYNYNDLWGIWGESIKIPMPHISGSDVAGTVLFFKGTNLLGATQRTKAGLEEVIGWVSKGKIKPVIDTILPFSNMVEGHIKMADSQLFGKIVTTPQIL